MVKLKKKQDSKNYTLIQLYMGEGCSVGGSCGSSGDSCSVGTTCSTGSNC